MRISTKAFTGMMPRVEPHLLPPSGAQQAVNTKLWSGSIGTFREPGFVANLAKVGTVKTIYRFGKHLDDDTRQWFHWLNDTDVTRGPIPDDTQERTYYTEAGQPPMVTDATMATANGLMPSASYRLGIPAPTMPAAVTVTPGSNPDDTLERQNCRLAYTFVSGWGEEGPPNAVSEAFNATTGDTINVVSMEGPPTGQYNITHKRLYISAVDANGTAVLRFWKEISAGETSYSAELDLTLLGEALPENPLIPPPESLFGLMAHPGGFLIGFVDQQVYRSETFKPYGWPYFSPVADDIVGGAVSGQATIICTKGSTYLATQADPITFTPVRLDGFQPCSSKRSIAVLSGGVVYASPDGLVAVSEAGLTVITEQLLTRDQWQAYNPASMMTVVHDDRAFIFFDNGVKKGSLILDKGPDGLSLIETTIHATAAYVDERRDELFLVVEQGKVHKWEGGAGHLVATYTSRKFIVERPQNLGAAMVIADAYPVTFTFRATIKAADGTDKQVSFTKTVLNGRPFRMPGNYRAREYEYTTSGTKTVKEVVIASTLGNITAE